jgi:hypothetical protein
MGQRMNATTIEVDAGHLSLVTHPEAIARLILQAAGSGSSSNTSSATPARRP